MGNPKADVYIPYHSANIGEKLQEGVVAEATEKALLAEEMAKTEAKKKDLEDDVVTIGCRRLDVLAAHLHFEPIKQTSGFESTGNENGLDHEVADEEKTKKSLEQIEIGT